MGRPRGWRIFSRFDTRVKEPEGQSNPRLPQQAGTLVAAPHAALHHPARVRTCPSEHSPEAGKEGDSRDGALFAPAGVQ